MKLLFLLLYKINFFLAFQQPSETPGPQRLEKDQTWGNFTLTEFWANNKWYVLGVLFIIAIMIFYKVQSKKERKKEENQRDQ